MRSSLFNRLTRARTAIVAKEAGTTRDNVVGTVSYRRADATNSKFLLVDTAGLKNPEDEFEASIQYQIEDAANSADVILVTVDGTLYPTDDDRLIEFQHKILIFHLSYA